MLRALVVLAGLAVTTNALSQTPNGAANTSPFDVYAAPQRLVKLPDDRQMNLYCTGTGSPTVLLDGGWTDYTLNWWKIQPRVASFTRVCSYDRAGYGFSDTGPMPRSAGAIADDLQQLLRAAHIKGPFVVAAHSLGAMSARLFASRPANDVVALILIEPAVEHQDDRLSTVSPGTGIDSAKFVSALRTCTTAVINGTIRSDTPERSLCLSPPIPSFPQRLNDVRQAHQMTTGYQQTLISELESVGAESSLELDHDGRTFGNMPLLVLTAENSQDNPALPAAEQAALKERWWAMHEELTHMSTRGEHRLVLGASHLVLREKPDVVVDAIREVVAEIKG